MTTFLVALAVAFSLVALLLSVLALKLSAQANERAGWVERRTWNRGVGHLLPTTKEKR